MVVTKLLQKAAKTLNYLALPYGPGVTSFGLFTISKMALLETLILGSTNTNMTHQIDNLNGSKLRNSDLRGLFRALAKNGNSKIRNLIIYEADANIAESLAKMPALEKLVIMRYYQRKAEICASSIEPDKLPGIS